MLREIILTLLDRKFNGDYNYTNHRKCFMNPGTENSLFGKHTSVYGRNFVFRRVANRCNNPLTWLFLIWYQDTVLVIKADKCKCFFHEVGSMAIQTYRAHSARLHPQAINFVSPNHLPPAK